MNWLTEWNLIVGAAKVYRAWSMHHLPRVSKGVVTVICTAIPLLAETDQFGKGVIDVVWNLFLYVGLSVWVE